MPINSKEKVKQIIIVPGKPVPKERMTTNQVKAAMIYQTPGPKFDRIRECMAYQKAVAACCMGKTQLKGYVKMTALFFIRMTNDKDFLPKQRGDLDNYIKASKDGLQYGGIFAPEGKNKKGNDKCVVLYGEGTGIYPADSENPEQTIIILEEMKAWEILATMLNKLLEVEKWKREVR